MPRLSRRFVAALLWIAIALLPVRGWAAVLMPVVMQHGPAVASAGDNAAPPCHGQTAQDTPADDATTAPGTCSMCDLCHTSVAQAPAAPQLAAAPHEPLPAAQAPTPIEPRAPDGLYRPPRTTLA
jgi:hypothetical protein